MSRAANPALVSLLLTVAALTFLGGCGGGEADAPPAAPAEQEGALSLEEAQAKLSNTGYEGSWALITNSQISVIDIRRSEAEGGYDFRWTLKTPDRKRRVTGDWEGHSEEFIGEEKAADYRFNSWMDEESNRLMVSCEAKSIESGNTLSYRDFLVVEADGLALTSFTIARDGKELAAGDRPPPRRYVKVADPGAEILEQDLSAGD